MSNAKNEQHEFALEQLRDCLPNGQEVHSVCIGVAKSGMSATYTFLVPILERGRKDGVVQERLAIRDITRLIGIVTDSRFGKDNQGVIVRGCGFNRPQSILDHVASIIKPEGHDYSTFRIIQRS